jgi:hypothetical protein
MQRSYTLAGRRFGSKASIKNHIRQYVGSVEIGSDVNDGVLIELLKKHPQWDEKSHGMTRLIIGNTWVEHASVYQKGVLIEKTVDHVDITWSRLVDRLQPDGSLRHVDQRAENLRKIKLAARAAIQDQILQVPKNPGDHVDHIYPRTFDRLLYLFLRWWHEPIESITVLDPEGLVIQPRFACFELEDNWSTFHQRVARLRAVPPEVNMAAKVYPVNWNILP